MHYEEYSKPKNEITNREQLNLEQRHSSMLNCIVSNTQKLENKIGKEEQQNSEQRHGSVLNYIAKIFKNWKIKVRIGTMNYFL